MYVWEVSTGNLLNVWPAHYSKVNQVVFTDDDSFLISGGEDAIIKVWNLADLLEVFHHFFFSLLLIILQANAGTIQPFCSWADHSLPISDLYIGAGGPNGRLASVSLDRTCKVCIVLEEEKQNQCLQTAMGHSFTNASVLLAVSCGANSCHHGFC